MFLQLLVKAQVQLNLLNSIAVMVSEVLSLEYFPETALTENCKFLEFILKPTSFNDLSYTWLPDF